MGFAPCYHEEEEEWCVMRAMILGLALFLLLQAEPWMASESREVMVVEMI